MPIYEFHCPGCGKDTEMLVRSSRWQGTACPHCGSTKLHKKLSVFAASSGRDDAPCGAGEACGMDRSACGGCCAGGGHRH
jgi:putative FmdB family regulatory protein